jgi:hypothetical protein
MNITLIVIDKKEQAAAKPISQYKGIKAFGKS